MLLFKIKNRRPVPLPRKLIMSTVLNLNFPSTIAPHRDPDTSPRYTMLPRDPNSTFDMSSSFLIETAADGIAPWSILMRISKKNKYPHTNITVLSLNPISST